MTLAIQPISNASINTANTARIPAEDSRDYLPAAYRAVNPATRVDWAGVQPHCVFIEVTNHCNLLCETCPRTFVTYEERKAGSMLEDELLAPGVVSSVYVSALAPARRGAWLLGAPDMYDIDDAHLALYARAAKSADGFQKYLDEFVLKTVAV